MSYETSPEFTAYLRRLELEALEMRLNNALAFLHDGENGFRSGYGLTGQGVSCLIDILRGEDGEDE